MIKYALQCGRAHRFDVWFRSGEDCARQLDARQVTCPHCGDDAIEKSLMAPSLATARVEEPRAAAAPAESTAPAAISAPSGSQGPASAEAPAPVAQMTTPAAMKRVVEAKLRALRSYVEANAEHVGPRFAEEARRIHEGESEERAIYGEASPEEYETLIEDGVPCAPLPWIDTRDD